MSTVATVLVSLIALEHVYFAALEMYFWTKPKGQKAFGLTPEFSKQTAGLAANQGLYNLFLVAGLVWSVIESRGDFAFCLKAFFLSCVFVAGVFGGATVNKRILYLQGIPALIALGVVLVGGHS